MINNSLTVAGLVIAFYLLNSKFIDHEKDKNKHFNYALFDFLAIYLT
jgi:hypothetical protein